MESIFEDNKRIIKPNDENYENKHKRILILVSKDGKKIKIDEKSAKRSLLLKDVLQDYEDNTEIPIPEIDGHVLEKIVEYLVHYRDKEPRVIPKPHPLYSLRDVTDDWDVDFIDSVSLEIVQDIIEGSNYMNIVSLLDLSCAKFAFLMKRKSADEIRKLFNLGECDIPEEELHDLDQYQIKDN